MRVSIQQTHMNTPKTIAVSTLLTAMAVACVGKGIIDSKCEQAATAGSNTGYKTGYDESTKFFQEWLLEVGYAEYDRRTGVWKLSEANTIQGDLIDPVRKAAMITIEDQIRLTEDELVVLRKQQAANSKRKQDIKKTAVDFKKL